jgi:hypothetical protein
VAETDSAANQFGAPESVNQRGIFPLFVALSAPRTVDRFSERESNYEDR